MFMLPGGGARKGESRINAAIRELKEETKLDSKSCSYLFSHNDPDDGRTVRNLHKVFLIEAGGEPKVARHEVHQIAYWNRDSNIRLGRTTKIIIEKYLNEFSGRSGTYSSSKSDLYYKVLGLRLGASKAEVKAAFIALAKQYHPDRLPLGATPAMRQLIDDKMKEINEAYQALVK